MCADRLRTPGADGIVFKSRLKSGSTIQSDKPNFPILQGQPPLEARRRSAVHNWAPTELRPCLSVSRPLHNCCVSSESKQQVKQQRGDGFVRTESQQRLQGEVRKELFTRIRKRRMCSSISKHEIPHVPFKMFICEIHTNSYDWLFFST